MERFVMERRCLFCRKRFTAIRNPSQRYCANPLCQKERRKQYQRDKLRNDPTYYESHQLSQKKWRAAHSTYWSEYRLNHPLYVHANRLAQENRDKKRHLRPAKSGRDFMLANMYSLICKKEYISCSYKIFLGTKTSLQICTL